ncbi:MAG: hypothetical protein AAGH41_12680 [Pseudomonadota bacterium]
MLLLALGTLLTSAVAEPADSYRACASIQGVRDRLACFDAAAKDDPVLVRARERAARSARNAEAQRLATAQNNALAAAQRRAAEAERRAREAEAALAEANKRADKGKSQRASIPSTFTGEIQSVRFAPYGEAVITLKDGQVWRQLSSDRELSERRVGKMKTVKVTKGRFGGWRMRIEPLGTTIRVRPRKDD